MLDASFTGGLTEREFKALGLSPEELSADFARVAREDRDHYLDVNRAALHANVGVLDITDRKRGAPPESVHMPGGIYIAEYQLASGVIRRALDILEQVSPVLTGHYAASHEVHVDGIRVMEPFDIGLADEIVIANRLIYARRLEAEWGGARVSKKTPQGPYWVTASRVNREFRGSFSATFTFWGAESPRTSRKHPRYGLDSGKYPVIIIRPV
jgi:hypothetical protein